MFSSWYVEGYLEKRGLTQCDVLKVRKIVFVMKVQKTIDVFLRCRAAVITFEALRFLLS